MKSTLALIVLSLALVLPGCGGYDNPASNSPLVSEDLVVGTGATAVTGDTISVDYVGRFQNGQQFDSSAGRGPFTFRLGASQVIAGWDQGIPGMRVGGRRRLTIPPNLAYGSTGQGPIPPNTTLVFEVELLSIAGR